MERSDITVIGAGVVGLAVAARLAHNNANIFVLEKEDSFGRGTSSRNSEVVHAGIYYPAESVKAQTCVTGNRMLYERCAQRNIPHKKLGKFIVATTPEEEEQIRALYQRGCDNGVTGLQVVDAAYVRSKEPSLSARSALYSPETGIVDAHALMDSLFQEAKQRGVNVVFRARVKSIEPNNNRYTIVIEDADTEEFRFASRCVVNAAGLSSDTIARMAGIDTTLAGYDLKYCKGSYFRLNSAKSRSVQRLIYPAPAQSDGGLGIHLTPDLLGQVRLGPDAQYLPSREENYDVDAGRAAVFYESVKAFAPFVERDDIAVDMAGIRPKLQGRGEDFRDFVIRDEAKRSLPGFINLIGIESPGLTAALAIAKEVEKLLHKYRN